MQFNEYAMQLLRLIIILFLGLGATLSFGQEELLEPVTDAYVLKNAHIIQAPGRSIERGSVVIKNGIIRAVGPEVIFPLDARIIAADSLFVYAGFIDGLSYAAVPEREVEMAKVLDPGNPPNINAGIQPQRDVRNMLEPADKSVSELRRQGFTTAHVVPHGKMLPGQGAIILLTGKKADDMVYKREFSLFSELASASGIYPNTVIGVMAKYRELYKKAAQARQYQLRYNEQPSGLERPQSNRVLEAFYPVIEKRKPVAFKAEDVLDIQRVLSLKEELGFDLILTSVKQGWDITDKLKASEAKLFLSLDLPELKEKADTVDSGAVTSKKKTAIELEKERLEQRKEEMINRYYHQPVLFNEKNIPYGFSSMGAETASIKATLVKMVDKGLSRQAALAALTTVPARMLGLSAVMGTVDAGKMANLVITNQPYFEEDSKVQYVFVDGHLYDYKEVPKGVEEKKDVVVTGKWAYTTETPQGVDSGELRIEGEEGDFSGTITSTLSADASELLDIEVDGNELSFSFEVVIGDETVIVEMLVTIKEDTFEGTMTTGEYGNYPVKGERVPKK